MTLRLEPLATVAPDAVVVGDPRRAFALAQAFTRDPRMTHIARGLWGYLGRFGERSLTIQSTGAGGGPAAAIVTDLAELGVRRMVRMGTCGAVGDELGLGTVCVVGRALGEDGASRALSGLSTAEVSVPVEPDRALTDAFGEAGPEVEVTSRDLTGRIDRGPRPETPIRDLQTAAFLMAARSAGVQAAAILVVVERGPGERLPESGVESQLAGLEPMLSSAFAARPPKAKPQVEG